MEHAGATREPEQEPLAEWESDFRNRMHEDGITSSEHQREVIKAMERAVIDRATKEGLIPPSFDIQEGSNT